MHRRRGRASPTPSGYIAKNENLADPVTTGPVGTYGSGSVIVPGIQHLSPEQALAFVRNRHTLPGGDSGRTYRQQAVIDYVLNSLRTGGVLSDVGKLSSLLSSAKQYVQFPQNCYARGRWVFDLVLSNPDSVKLYKLSPQQYVKTLGCRH